MEEYNSSQNEDETRKTCVNFAFFSVSIFLFKEEIYGNERKNQLRGKGKQPRIVYPAEIAITDTCNMYLFIHLGFDAV